MVFPLNILNKSTSVYAVCENIVALQHCAIYAIPLVTLASILQCSITKIMNSLSCLSNNCYESPKKEIVSCAFEHLIHNIKIHNRVKI